MRSCSFRHRWFEFDIGYFYIKILSFFKLAEVRHVFLPSSLKQEWSQKMLELIEKDYRFKSRCEELARDLNTNYQDLTNQIAAYFSGEKVKLEKSVELFLEEVKQNFRANQKIKLRYN
jgi:hypothetical protein